MTKLPAILPDYTIEKLNQEPFSAKWEELQGWGFVPRLGEKLSAGLYDFPSRKRTEYMELETVGKAEVHGIQGVEIADPRLLRPDPQGGLHLTIRVAGGTEANWVIESLGLDVYGRTGPR